MRFPTRWVEIFVLLLLPSMAAFSQSSYVIYYDSTWRLTTKPLGRYFRIGVLNSTYYKFSGEVKDHFMSGQLAMKGTYTAGTKVDTFYFYYPDGKLNAKGLYRENRRYGIWTYYHPNGKMRDRVFFDNDFICALECHDVSGKPIMVMGTGVWRTRYFDDLLGDSVEIEGAYKDTLRHGPWRAYRKSFYKGKWTERKLHGFEEYQNGRFVKGKYYGSLGGLGRDIGNPTFSVLTETEKFKRMESWEISHNGDPSTGDYPFLKFLHKPVPTGPMVYPYDIPLVTDDEVQEVVSNMEKVFHSVSGKLILDLKEFPESVIKRISFMSDSLTEYKRTSLSSYHTKVAQSKVAQLGEVGPSIFIANKSDPWRSTDVILGGAENLPTRRFLFAIADGDGMVFAYWHGGISLHMHMYYVSLNKSDRLTGFVTTNNTETFLKLDRKGKWDKFRTTEWKPLVRVSTHAYRPELRVFQGKIAYEWDEL